MARIVSESLRVISCYKNKEDKNDIRRISFRIKISR